MTLKFLMPLHMLGIKVVDDCYNMTSQVVQKEHGEFVKVQNIHAIMYST